MITETIEELAEEALEAGDNNTAIVLFCLAGSIRGEETGALYKLALLCQEHSRSVIAEINEL